MLMELWKNQIKIKKIKPSEYMYIICIAMNKRAYMFKMQRNNYM